MFLLDEFAVFQIESADITLTVLITRLQIIIDSYNSKKDLKYKISLSVGMSCRHTDHHKSLDDLMSQADSSMYEQKRQKKSTVIKNCD